MTVAITGGTGFVGQALIDAALARGLEVRALARSPQPERDGVEWIAGSLADDTALRRLTTGAAAVIHVAGLVKASHPAGFEAVNVRGTLAVIEAALAERVPRLVAVSSLSAREPELSAYGASKAHAERLVGASPLDWTIVRPPAVYGPGDRDLLDLFRAARWGVVPMPAAGHASLIHVADLAALLLALVPADPALARRTFEPDDGRPGGWEHADLARAIGRAVGRNPRVLRLSARAMARAAAIDVRLRGARAKLTLDRLGYLAHPDWVVSPAARVPADVWAPAIPTIEGLRATAAWYREQRWL